MSKGSGRRKENTALVEANWPFPAREVWVSRAEAVAMYDDGVPPPRALDQAYVEQTRQDNLAAANRDTEQDATDGK